MAQTLIYTSVVSAGAGWTNGSGVSASGGTTADFDAGGDPQVNNGILKIALSNPTDPQDHNNHIVYIESHRDAGTVLEMGTATITVELRESGTLRDSFTITPNNTTDTVQSNTLTTGEAGAITNYSNLELWLTCAVDGGSVDYRKIYVDHVYVSIPDLAVPDVPTNVTATDGLTAKITIDWNASARADSYKIYRNTTNSIPANPLYSGVTATQKDDTNNGGTLYYWWVKATNASGDSAASTSTTGWRLGTPGVPSGLTASERTYTDKVALSWTDTSGAYNATETYDVYINTINSLPGTPSYTGIATTSKDHTGPTEGFHYYYWVKALNNAGAWSSAASTMDQGWTRFVLTAPSFASSMSGTATGGRKLNLGATCASSFECTSVGRRVAPLASSNGSASLETTATGNTSVQHIIYSTSSSSVSGVATGSYSHGIFGSSSSSVNGSAQVSGVVYAIISSNGTASVSGTASGYGMFPAAGTSASSLSGTATATYLTWSGKARVDGTATGKLIGSAFATSDSVIESTSTGVMLHGINSTSVSSVNSTSDGGRYTPVSATTASSISGTASGLAMLIFYGTGSSSISGTATGESVYPSKVVYPDVLTQKLESNIGDIIYGSIVIVGGRFGKRVYLTSILNAIVVDPLVTQPVEFTPDVISEVLEVEHPRVRINMHPSKTRSEYVA